MADDNLIKSKSPGGAHNLLEKLTGRWEGNTKTWFEPGKLADVVILEKDLTAIHDYLKKMTAAGHIRVSKSPFGAIRP